MVPSNKVLSRFPYLKGIGHRVVSVPLLSPSTPLLCVKALAAMRWSESASYFVDGSLKVYSVVDLSSEPLKMVPVENVIYDGPGGDDFKNLLLDNGFRVNCHGRAIVRIPKRNSDGEYNYFLLQNLVQLSTYGFTKVGPSPPPPTQELNVLKSILEETRADLAQKNDEVVEFHRNWNFAQLRLTLNAIAESLKKVLVEVDIDLKPPATITRGRDPIIYVVLEFLDKLRSLLHDKQVGGGTLLGAADVILASIVSIFDQRNGLSIKSGMVTSRTPHDLIQNLNSLKEFVESRFFIDGSVIVKAYGLMNKEDIPVICRDSEGGVAELYRKDVGPNSIVNIDGESIFYGYFNIPSVGKFKGILTRFDVLPKEIIVKLRHRPNQLDDEAVWFCKANGDAIFEKYLTPGIDFLGFLLRIKNKTFVNKEGKYLKFDFTTIKVAGLPSVIPENSVTYIARGWGLVDPFIRVQYDRNESPQAISEESASIPTRLSPSGTGNLQYYMNNYAGEVQAFVFKNLCFIGKITQVSDEDFRSNTLVSQFFGRLQSEEACYVDPQATTFFVCNLQTSRLDNTENRAPKLNN